MLRQKRDELNEFDIYELDSFHKKIQDFLNNLEISLYKLNSMTIELKGKFESCSLMDICENIMMRKAETQLSLVRIQRIEK